MARKRRTENSKLGQRQYRIPKWITQVFRPRTFKQPDYTPLSEQLAEKIKSYIQKDIEG